MDPRQKDLVKLIKQSLKHHKNDRYQTPHRFPDFQLADTSRFPSENELGSPGEEQQSLPAGTRLKANAKRFGGGCYKFCSKTTHPLTKRLPNLHRVAIVLYAQLRMHRSFCI